jgi:DNA-binding transcriptional MerR regulator
VTAQQLRRLVELGIITPTPQGHYRSSDIQRIRVVDALADAGIAPEQLAQLIAIGAYDLDWTSVVYPEPTAQTATTLEQAAAATGLSERLAARLFDAWELPRPQPGQALRADDDELLHLATPALAGFGHDETALLGAARQLGDSLRRLAELSSPVVSHPRRGALGRPGASRPFLVGDSCRGQGVAVVSTPMTPSTVSASMAMRWSSWCGGGRGRGRPGRSHRAAQL